MNRKLQTSVSLDRQDMDALDRLVDKKRFSSLSEAVRHEVTEFLKRENLNPRKRGYTTTVKGEP